MYRAMSAALLCMVELGAPGHIRSENGPEFIAGEVKDWIESVGVTTLYIGPGAPW